MALIQALTDLYVTMNTRKVDLVLDPREGKVDKEDAALKVSKDVTAIRLNPIPDSKGSGLVSNDALRADAVQVLFPGANNRALYFGKGDDHFQIRPTTMESDPVRFRFKVERDTDKTSCFRLRSLADDGAWKQPYVKGNTQRNVLEPVKDGKNAQLFCLADKPKEEEYIVYTPKDVPIESGVPPPRPPPPPSPLRYEYQTLYNFTIEAPGGPYGILIPKNKPFGARDEVMASIYILPFTKSATKDGLTDRSLVSEGRISFVNADSRNDTKSLYENEDIMIKFSDGKEERFAYNGSNDDYVSGILPNEIDSKGVPEGSSTIVKNPRARWNLIENADGTVSFVSVHNTKQAIAPIKSEFPPNEVGRLGIGDVKDAFRFRINRDTAIPFAASDTASGSGPETTLGKGQEPGGPQQPSAETLKYGVPYRWIPEVTPAAVPILRQYKQETAKEVRLGTPGSPISAQNALVVFYIDPMNPTAVGTELKSDGMAFVVLARRSGNDRYVLYSGQGDTWLGALPADKLLSKAFPRSRGAWRLFDSGSGGYVLRPMNNEEQALTVIDADGGDVSVYGGRRLGIQNKDEGTPVSFKHEEVTGVQLGLTATTFPKPSDWSESEKRTGPPAPAPKTGILSMVADAWDWFSDLPIGGLLIGGLGAYAVMVGIALVVFLIVVSFIF